MSELEKDAKKVSKKVKKSEDLGHGAERIGDDSWQKKYGIDYFNGTSAKRHAQNTEIKAKALEDIREIYTKSTGLKDANLVSNVSVTDKDVEAYKAFLDLEYLRDFEDYTGKAYLKGATPAQVKWIHGIYPEIFERRVKELEKILNVQKKYAMLQIMGPQSREDLLFEYELNNMEKRDPAKFERILHKSVAESVGAKETKFERGALSIANMFRTYPGSNDDRYNTNGTFMGAKPTEIMKY